MAKVYSKGKETYTKRTSKAKVSKAKHTTKSPIKAYDKTKKSYERKVKQFEKTYLGKDYGGQKVQDTRKGVTSEYKSAQVQQMRADIRRMDAEIEDAKKRQKAERARILRNQYITEWDNYTSTLCSEIKRRVDNMNNSHPKKPQIMRQFYRVAAAFDGMTKNQKMQSGAHLHQELMFNKTVQQLGFAATFTYNESKHESLLVQLKEVLTIMHKINPGVEKELRSLYYVARRAMDEQSFVEVQDEYVSFDD